MRTAEQLVSAEVHYCVSYLVSTLAGRGHQPAASTPQAQELAAPIADYEEAAIQAGWHREADGSWFRAALDSDGEDVGTLRVTEATAEDACERDDIEPYDREVFEHWIVSRWLAEKLAAKGEKVDSDFAGMTVWARTTTGQAISIDAVIVEIVTDLAREYGA